jgi:hypothetical protein
MYSNSRIRFPLRRGVAPVVTIHGGKRVQSQVNIRWISGGPSSTWTDFAAGVHRRQLPITAPYSAVTWSEMCDRSEEPRGTKSLYFVRDSRRTDGKWQLQLEQIEAGDNNREKLVEGIEKWQDKIKVKLSLYLFNHAPRHEDVCRSGGTAPAFLTSAQNGGDLSALCTGCFTPPRGWVHCVGPTSGLDAVNR